MFSRHRRARPHAARPGSRLPAPRAPDPEHLLFAIINETSGDKILRAAGANTEKIKADLDTFLDENLETLPLGAKRPPDQTLAFRRVLQTAVLHVQSAGQVGRRTSATSWPRSWPRGGPMPSTSSPARA
jgi:hypothetical protein